MYAKDPRRPTPPRNYGGTAFREQARDSVRDTPSEAQHNVPCTSLSPASPYLATSTAPSSPPSPSSPSMPHDLPNEPCSARKCAADGAPTDRTDSAEPSAAQSEAESAHAIGRRGESNADDTSAPPSDTVASPDSGLSGAASTSGETSAGARQPPSPVHGLLGALIPPSFDAAHGNGLGFEELLLTGLILLLSQSQRDSDIILMLALLLFYQ